jgi:GNAT superfamily N-acetyltransferase
MENGDHKLPFSLVAEDDLPLKIFYRRHARASSLAWITRSYVADADDNHFCGIAGYVSIMCAEVALEKTYPLTEKPTAEQYPYQPAARIARLAVCDDAKGKDVGTALVEFTIGLLLRSVTPRFGCRFLIVNSKQKSIGFYEKMDFKLLDTPANKTAPHPVMFFDLLRQGGSTPA